MSGIDPIRLAQFMVLPGAQELVDAFSAIPPGPIRDSVVHHARVLAEASGWNPPAPFAAHETARIITPPAKHLPSPFAEGLASVSAEGQIVERLMRGEPDHVVAADLGVKLGLIVRLKRKARQEGGVVFPGDEKPQPKPRPKKGYKLKLDRFPVPDPPYWWEDPASPVWKNPNLLPAFSEDARGSMAAIGPLDRRNFATMAQAAARHGETLAQYIERRYEIIRRTDSGETPTEISLAMRIGPFVVYDVLSRVGRGRMETLAAKLIADPPPAPVSLPPAHGGALYQKQQAAGRWGFTSVEAFDAMRERVREYRARGWHQLRIANAVGMSLPFIKATVKYWSSERGVKFPPAPYRLKDRAA
jgi:hypothetical protein